MVHSFNASNSLISDRGSHFKNEAIRLLSKALCTSHHFTLLNTLWSNGWIEKLNKEVLRIFRALFSELKLYHKQWLGFVQIVQSALKNAPSTRQRNLAPVTIFTEHQKKNLVPTFIREDNGVVLTIKAAKKERILNIRQMQKIMHDLSPIVASKLQLA